MQTIQSEKNSEKKCCSKTLRSLCLRSQHKHFYYICLYAMELSLCIVKYHPQHNQVKLTLNHVEIVGRKMIVRLVESALWCTISCEFGYTAQNSQVSLRLLPSRNLPNSASRTNLQVSLWWRLVAKTCRELQVYLFTRPSSWMNSLQSTGPCLLWVDIVLYCSSHIIPQFASDWTLLFCSHDRMHHTISWEKNLNTAALF
jgi:hypothetical protein